MNENEKQIPREEKAKRKGRLHRPPAPQEPLTAPKKLKLIVTIVDRSKAEFYTDVLSTSGVNFQVVFSASGTAKTEMLNLLGLGQTEKAVIVSAIRDDEADAALETLEEKSRTIKNGQGISFSIPMTSVIGVAIYQLLANDRSAGRGDTKQNRLSERKDNGGENAGKGRDTE